MASPLLTPRRILLILAVLLLVNSLLPTRLASKASYLPRVLVSFATAPVAAPLRAVAESMRAAPTEHPQFGGDMDIQLELESRIQQVRALEEALREAQDQIALLSQSREIALAGVRFVPTRVTGYSGDRVRPMISLDRGRARGIVEGAPVVSGFNLVGRVTRAYPGGAEAELISARETQLQVRILPPRTVDTPRELVEMITMSEDGRRFEVQVSVDVPVEIGDLAHLIDERWPPEARGFVVGMVRSVTPDRRDPLRFKQVLIYPLPPLESLSRVTVLTTVE